MKISSINEILGNSIIAYGTIRIILSFMLLISTISMLLGNDASIDTLNDMTDIVNAAGVIMIMGCLIMLIVNKKKNTGVVKGYVITLVVVLINEILPYSFPIGVFINIIISMQYVKAGNRVKRDNEKYYPRNKKSAKEIMAKSEWFFNDGENNKDIDNGSEKLEKKRTKIEQEIEGWKDGRIY